MEKLEKKVRTFTIVGILLLIAFIAGIPMTVLGATKGITALLVIGMTTPGELWLDQGVMRVNNLWVNPLCTNETFVIFVLPGCSRQDILMKVFSFYPESEIWKISSASGIGGNTHSLYTYAPPRGVLYTRCGVLFI